MPPVGLSMFPAEMTLATMPAVGWLGLSVAMVTEALFEQRVSWVVFLVVLVNFAFVWLVLAVWKRQKRPGTRRQFLELAVRLDLRSKQLLDEDEDYPPGSGEGDPSRPLDAKR